MHSLYSFDAHVYCFQVIFGILSICLRAEGASASWSSSWFGSGAGNKRVSIVSVRLSLIMKTAATLSLENAFAITIASQSCHPPRSLLERDSLINATSLILKTQSLLVLPPFVALSQRQLKFVAIGYGRRRREQGSKEEYEEGPAMGSRNSISFAHRLQIILELPNMGMT